MFQKEKKEPIIYSADSKNLQSYIYSYNIFNYPQLNESNIIKNKLESGGRILHQISKMWANFQVRKLTVSFSFHILK